MLTRDSTELTDPGWSHHTGGTRIKVVPCDWRATAGENSMVSASAAIARWRLVQLGPLTGAATPGWWSTPSIASAPHDAPSSPAW